MCSCVNYDKVFIIMETVSITTLWLLHLFYEFMFVQSKDNDRYGWVCCVCMYVYYIVSFHFMRSKIYQFVVVVWCIVCLAAMVNTYCILSIDVFGLNDDWTHTYIIYTLKCKSIKDRPHQTHFVCLLCFNTYFRSLH